MRLSGSVTRRDFFCGPHYHFVYAFVYVRHGNDLSACANGKYGRFVEQVFQVRPRKACRYTRHRAEVYVGAYRLFAGVHLQNSFATAHVGTVDVNLPVETSGAQQCGIQNVRAVGCRHYYYVGVGFKTVHFHQQLVERLFSFVVTAAQTCAALTPPRRLFRQ